MISRSKKISLTSFPPYMAVLVAWVALIIIVGSLRPTFLTEDNLANIVRSSSIAFVVGMGVTLTVLTRGLDLSVGSLVAFTGVVALFFLERLPEPAALVIAIVGTALFAGLVNGLLVGKVRLPPILVTLGTLAVFRGLALVISNGDIEPAGQYRLPALLGDEDVGGVPIVALVMAIVYLSCLYFLRYRQLGRDMYAVGGNEDAARLCGINVARVRLWAYIISAGIAALAGILLIGRLASVSPTVGAGLELQVAAAVLLGGTSLTGGAGGVTGTAVAILFLTTLQNGLTILGISSFWQLVVTGVVLVVAVLVDRLKTDFVAKRIAALGRKKLSLGNTSGAVLEKVR